MCLPYQDPFFDIASALDTETLLQARVHLTVKSWDESRLPLYHALAHAKGWAVRVAMSTDGFRTSSRCGP